MLRDCGLSDKVWQKLSMIEQQSRENMAGVRVRGGGRVRQQVRVSSVRSGQVGECLKSMLTILASRAVVVRHSSLCFGEVRYNNKFDLQTSCSCRGGHIRLCRFSHQEAAQVVESSGLQVSAWFVCLCDLSKRVLSGWACRWNLTTLRIFIEWWRVFLMTQSLLCLAGTGFLFTLSGVSGRRCLLGHVVTDKQ